MPNNSSYSNILLKKTNIGSEGFQRKIIITILRDKKFGRKILPYLKPEYFTKHYLSVILKRIKAYFSEYNNIPNDDTLKEIIFEELTSPLGRTDSALDGVREFFDSFSDTIDDKLLEELDYVRKKSFDFCKKQASISAVEEVLNGLEEEGTEEFDYNKALSLLTTRLTLDYEADNANISPLLDFQEALKPNLYNSIPTGLIELDKVLPGGGLPNKALGLIIAPTGIGKSQWLNFVSCNAFMAGFNVLYVSAELDVPSLKRRAIATITQVPNDSLDIELEHEVQQIVEEFWREGKLFFRVFPAGRCNTRKLQNFITEQEIINNVDFDLIIIDYDKLFKATTVNNNARGDEIAAEFYEECAGMMVDMGKRMWLASQGNRESWGKKVVDFKMVADAFAKLQPVTVGLTLGRTESDVRDNMATLFLGKNRFAKTTMLAWEVEMDTTISWFKIVRELSASNKHSVNEVKNLIAQLKRNTNTSESVQRAIEYLKKNLALGEEIGEENE